MDLATKAKSAVKWAAGLTLLAQFLMWVVTIFVIRILLPEDYGLMAMSMVFISFAMIVNELGLGTALVQKQDLSEDEVQAVHGFILVLNFGLLLFFLISAPAIALFFDEPMLKEVIPVIAFSFPILGFEVVAVSLLEKNLEFKKKTSIYLIANVAGGIATLLFALNEFGVWSLVYGNILAAVIKAVAINVSVGRFIIPKWNFGKVRPLLGFGGIVATERTLWFIHSQADVFLIGKILGKEQLGYYYVALNLASLVYNKTGGLIHELSLPIFANAQAEVDTVRRFFVRALRITSFVVFPVMFGLSAVSNTAVELVLGANWVAAAPLVMILSLSMPARIIGNLFPPALQGTGHPKSSLINLLIAVGIMVPAIAIGAVFGTSAVAWVWLLVYPIVIVIVIVRSNATLGIRWSDSRRAIVAPFVASLAMFAAVIAIEAWLTGAGLVTSLRLLAIVLVGVAVFAALSAIGLREQLREFLSFVGRR